MLFSISSTKQIIDPSGNRFVVRGVTMFDYLFVSYEPRHDYGFRQTGMPTPPVGISKPTGFGKVSYKSMDDVHATLELAAACGVNLIRVAVEPAMLNANVPYLDGGVIYPSDMAMLDCIVDKASTLGIVVQLQNGNDRAPIGLSIAFLQTIGNIYANNPYVWINPANELNGANDSGLVNDVDVWRSTMAILVGAVRSGGRFKNPIVINPPHFGEDLAGVSEFLLGDAVFKNDPCLIVGVHLYPQKGEHDFRTCRLPAEILSWYRFRKSHCIFVDEVGLDNYAGRYDPTIDPAIGSQGLVEFERMKSWGLDFLDWAWQQSILAETLHGVTGISWFAYIPGMQQHDDNTMRHQDRTTTVWGNIFNTYTSRSGKAMETPSGIVWNDYTPTFSSSAGFMAAATSQGKYARVGDLCFFKAYLSIQNVGNASGELIAGLPTIYGVPLGISSAVSGVQIVNDFSLFCRTLPNSPFVKFKKYDGSFPGASGAQFIINGWFEVAPL